VSLHDALAKFVQAQTHKMYSYKRKRELHNKTCRATPTSLEDYTQICVALHFVKSNSVERCLLGTFGLKQKGTTIDNFDFHSDDNFESHQPVSDKKRLKMVVELQMEILDAHHRPLFKRLI